MRHMKSLMVGSLVMAAAAAVGQMSNTPEQPKPEKTGPQVTAAGSSRGQQVFKQNCYRCHQEPEGFSQSISGAIAKHMRVRAGLSEEDYKALMKFLNP
jgi:cytochrome c5